MSQLYPAHRQPMQDNRGLFKHKASLVNTSELVCVLGLLALIMHGEEYISREDNGSDRFMDVGQKRMCGLNNYILIQLIFISMSFSHEK